MTQTQLPDVCHEAGEKLHGFTIDRVTPIEDVRAIAYEMTHDVTGAQVLHLHAEDRENLLAIGFRTPPSDSTGVPHILEHSVLSGSERFPVKDAFNELSRGSLATFLNAMTWPDKTYYPVASAVRGDYFNLATVYLDVTLHPRLSEQTFLQEGHHLELEDLDDLESPLTISGVVYNEMKGSYSSADRLTGQYLQEGLYPDNCYGLSSGGDPEVIPELTFEAFREFHHRFYSLSNARVFLYGDISTAEQLAFLEGEFERNGPPQRVEVDSTIPEQPQWSEPRRIENEYPVAKEESLEKKTVVNIAWMAAETADPEETIVLSVLYQALLGTAAGPLRKALLESELGEDVSPDSGYDTDYRQSMFIAGLRGTEGESAEEIEKLVLDTLRRLADEGIDEELLRGAFHQFEFASKEIGSSYPVRLLFRAIQTWNYDADPKVGLALSAAIDGVRTRWEINPRLFSEAIRTWLLDNPHRLLAICRPSRTLAEEQESAFREKMAARKEALTPAEVEQIRDAAVELKQAQETPDPPEVLATLPRVKAEDIPRELPTVPTRITEIGGVTVLEHELFTSGVTYLGLSFDSAPVADEHQTLLPYLSRLTTGMGAAGLSFDEMARRKSLFTGGIGAGVSAMRHRQGANAVVRLSLLGRALDRNCDALASILRDLLTEGDLGDIKRAGDLLLEMRNGARGGILQAGHGQARLLAAAAHDLPSYRSEQYGGLSQIRFLDEAARNLDQRLPELLERVAIERPRIFSRARLVANITADAEGLVAARNALASVIAALPEGSVEAASSASSPAAPRVGFAFASQVNYLATVSPAPNIDDPVAPSLAVLCRLLSDGYFYERLRVLGGAYGGFCSFDPVGAQLSALSYRDPGLTRTIEVFQQVATAAGEPGAIDAESVEKAIIGTIGGFDQILAPGAKGSIAMRRHLADVNDEVRRGFREGILEVTRERVIEEALPVLERSLTNATLAVVGARERIEEANGELTEPFEIRGLD
jgi:presequence protease